MQDSAQQTVPRSPDDWQTEPLEVVLERLSTNARTGLTAEKAAEMLRLEGPNSLAREAPINVLSMLRSQFASSVVLLLVAASLISFFMREYLQMAGIIAAIFINAAIGFITDYRSKVSLESLARLAGATVRVRRHGNEMDLPVSELVRGDIVLLEPGTRIPADLRIIESAKFSVDESLLSGESIPVWKEHSAVDDSQLDRNITYQGSSVLSGRAVGVVIATGSRTRTGKLGQMLQEVVSGETPLTRSLDTLGHQMTIMVVALCVAFGLLGLLRNEPAERMLETSIALAVAATPEGLPVIATLALAAGVRRMVRAKALVRRLPAVETLGCTTVICTDKTGTLTENKMQVTDLVIYHEHLAVSGNGYAPEGQVAAQDGQAAPDLCVAKELLTAACLCNDARLENHGDEEGWHVHGDPTEGALIAAACKVGLKDATLREQYPRIDEIPFDLHRKRMSTLHTSEQAQNIIYTKGSPGTVIPICSHIQDKEGIILLDAATRERFNSSNVELARRGLRVLAVAKKAVGNDCSVAEHDIEKDLVLIGLVAMSDRPKENVEQAIKKCLSAGIRVVMLTGDQVETARAVGHELGIIDKLSDTESVVTGKELQQLSQDQLKDRLDTVSVLARVTPEMKLDVVRQLQQAGHIVAMTGDGVNDAPALRQSNIGIAMGQAGTDLAREAAHLVITDDNFATIVKAIEQGRVTYENIKRAVAYLLTASVTSVFAITLGLLLKVGLFLLPLQLLYLNLIMHIFPGFGIILQKGDPEIMKASPRSKDEKLLDRYEQMQMVTRSALISLATMIAIGINEQRFGDESAGTIALSTLSLSLILQSWSWLTAGKSEQFFMIGHWSSNKPMWINTAIGVGLLVIAVYWTPLSTVLETKPLAPEQVLIVCSTALSTFILSMPLGLLARQARFVGPH